MENLIKPYNCDVFIFAPKRAYAGRNDDNFKWWSGDQQQVNIKFLKAKLGPRLKGIKLWDYNKASFMRLIETYGLPKKNKVGQPIWRTYSLFFHMQSVLNMMNKYEVDNRMRYDCVILTRFDVWFFNKFKIRQLNLNRVYYPLGEGVRCNKTYIYKVCRVRNEDKCINESTRNVGAAKAFGLNCNFNDQIIIGSSKNISSLKNIYTKIADRFFGDKLMLNNETLIAKHFLDMRIKFGSNDFVSYALHRHNNAKIEDKYNDKIIKRIFTTPKIPEGVKKQMREEEKKRREIDKRKREKKMREDHEKKMKQKRRIEEIKRMMQEKKLQQKKKRDEDEKRKRQIMKKHKNKK